LVWHDFLEDDEVQTLTGTKPVCPECNKNNVALIFWGYPGDMDWYLKAIQEKEIVGGGCLVSENDPKLECTDCYWQWGTREDDDE
jgi:hypothetical protein